MAELQISFVAKHEHSNPYLGITTLGGNGWRWTRQRIAEAIKKKEHTFFTFVDLDRAEVGVIHDTDGEYIRTHIDGQWNDHLLVLDECR
jgi:hypothetical protein